MWQAEKNLVERYALKSANQSANAADVDNEGTLVDDNIYAYPQYAPNDMNYGRGYSPDKYPSVCKFADVCSECDDHYMSA